MQETLSFSSYDGRAVSVFQGDLRALERTVAGSLIWPGHPEYDGARRVWNGLVDKRPGLIIRCARESDIVAAVGFARDHGLELAVRGGGHNVAGRAIADGALVIDLSAMRRVTVDPRARTVTSGGGATLGDVDGATHPLGLATPLGLVGATGLAGFTLHGGYGWLSRRFGLSSDNLVSARVVLADGRVLRASADENTDLFWALRGGGGNFGAVTSFEHRVYPVGPSVWFGMVVYPLESADTVMRIFRESMAQAPDELGALMVYWSAPEIPQIPEDAHGTPVLIVLLVYTGALEEGERVIGPLRRVVQPLADLSAVTSFTEVQRFFDADYPAGRLYYWKSSYMPELPDEVLAGLSRQTLRRPSSLSSIDVWGLGGAMGRIAVEETAFARRDSPFLIGVEGNWDEASMTKANIEWTRETLRGVERFARGGTYLNFPGFAEEGEALVRGAYGANYERLCRLKAKYDPDNLFRGNFNIGPAHPS